MRSDIVAKKLCNFLIDNAQVNYAAVSRFAEATQLDVDEQVLDSVLETFRSAYGGLWVGGVAQLSKGQLNFVPNAMNRAVHSNDCSVSVPLRLITSVEVIPAFFTKIIAISTRHGVFKMRCYGAQQFADAITKALAEQ